MKEDFKLSDIPKRNIYEVPERYFDRLPAQIMERTASSGYSTAPWYAAVLKPMRLALVPLLLLLVVGVVYFTQLNSHTEDHTLNLASMADEDIMNYLSTYAVLESGDFAEFTSISEREMTADFLNVSPATAEAELEYYQLNTIDY
jgi:hypothetical protein